MDFHSIKQQTTKLLLQSLLLVEESRDTYRLQHVLTLLSNDIIKIADEATDMVKELEGLG